MTVPLTGQKHLADEGLVVSHPAPASGPRLEIPSPSGADQPGPRSNLQHFRGQPFVQGAVQLADEAQELRALSTRLSLLQHHRHPMAGEQLLTGLQGLGLVSSKHRHPLLRLQKTRQ